MKTILALLLAACSLCAADITIARYSPARFQTGDKSDRGGVFVTVKPIGSPASIRLTVTYRADVGNASVNLPQRITVKRTLRIVEREGVYTGYFPIGWDAEIVGVEIDESEVE